MHAEEAASVPSEEPASKQPTLGDDNPETSSRGDGGVDETRTTRPRPLRPDAASFRPSGSLRPEAPSFMPSASALIVSPSVSSSRPPNRVIVDTSGRPQLTSFLPNSSSSSLPHPIFPPSPASHFLRFSSPRQPFDSSSASFGSTVYSSLPSSQNPSASRSQNFPHPFSPRPPGHARLPYLNISQQPGSSSSLARIHPNRRKLGFSSAFARNTPVAPQTTQQPHPTASQTTMHRQGRYDQRAHLGASPVFFPGYPPPGMTFYPGPVPPYTGTFFMGPQFPQFVPFPHPHPYPYPQPFFAGPFGQPIPFPVGPGFPQPGAAAFPVGPAGPYPSFGPQSQPQGNLVISATGNFSAASSNFWAAPNQFWAPPGHIALGPTLSMPREMAVPQAPSQQGLNQSAGNISRGTGMGVPAATGTSTTRGARPLIPTAAEFRPASARDMSTNEEQTARSSESTVSQRPSAVTPQTRPGQPQRSRLVPVPWQVAAARASSRRGSQVPPSGPFGPWVNNPMGGPSGLAQQQAAPAMEISGRPQNTGISQAVNKEDNQQGPRDGRGEPVTPPNGGPVTPQGAAPVARQLGSPSVYRPYLGPSDSRTPWTTPSPPTTPTRNSLIAHEEWRVRRSVEVLPDPERLERQLQALEEYRAQVERRAEEQPEDREANVRLASMMADPSHPFSSWPRTPRTGQAGQRRLADPTEQLVSPFDQVFENLSSYVNGYSNYQGLPRDANTVGISDVSGRLPRHQPSWRHRAYAQPPDWENPEVLNDPEIRGNWPNNASTGPDNGPSGTDQATPPWSLALGPPVVSQRGRVRRWLSPRAGHGLNASPEAADAYHWRLEDVKASPWRSAPQGGHH